MAAIAFSILASSSNASVLSRLPPQYPGRLRIPHPGPLFVFGARKYWGQGGTFAPSLTSVKTALTNSNLCSFGVSRASGISNTSMSEEIENSREKIESSRAGNQREMFSRLPYSPPPWASHLSPRPSEIFCLAQLPTPIHRWNVPGLPDGVQLFIKRDDLSGMQLSGNKVRKLEMLIAKAIQESADSVVTIGGIQSNHCRGTAVAARYAGLEPHLILRTSKALIEEDPGLGGNLLVERMVGAEVNLVTKESYAKLGSEKLGEALVRRLEGEGKKPFLIPVGGSNALGTWGYLEAIRELEEQLRDGRAGGACGFEDIVLACGSGGTTAGIALGVHLSSLSAKVHAFSVCDSPDYFYSFIQNILDDLSAHVSASDIVSIVDVKGQGYALSTKDELQRVKEVAEATGVILDPVYSGKALCGLLRSFEEDPEKWKGRRILFLHTGGMLGMFDKETQLKPLMKPTRVMDV